MYVTVGNGLQSRLCMQQAEHLCCCSYLFTYFVTVPHSILTQLAWPLSNAQQGDGLLLPGSNTQAQAYRPEMLFLQQKMEGCRVCEFL